MKIGYDAKRFFHNKTGLGNYSRNLIKIISDLYPENQYFLFNPKKSFSNTLESYNDSITEVSPDNKFHKKFKSLWRLFLVKSKIYSNKIDIYHGLSGEIPIGLNSRKVKTVVTIHDLIFVRYPNLYSFIDRKIHFWKFSYSAKKSDLVVAISEQTKNDIVNFLKIDPKRIKVIYQGCNNVFKEEFDQTKLDFVSKKFSLPTKFILNVGTIEKRKNLLTIIKAIKNTDVPLVVIGKKTKYFKEINLFLKKNKMENQVVFLKNVNQEELAIIYRLATIFVYPSIFEGFGIPIIESLYSKTPVISSTGSCFIEAGGPNSVYINPKNVTELKEAILSIWENPILQKEMIEKGHQFVQKFNDDVIADIWINTYKDLISGKPIN